MHVRVHTCCAATRDGEDELLNSMVAEEAPEKKLQTSVVLGGALTVGAIVVATLCGKDPWGEPWVRVAHSALPLGKVDPYAQGWVAAVCCIHVRSRRPPPARMRTPRRWRLLVRGHGRGRGHRRRGQRAARAVP